MTYDEVVEAAAEKVRSYLEPRRHAPWPRRIAGVPFCPECGMTVGHWPGAPCNDPERAYDRVGLASELSGPGAAQTARDQASPSEEELTCQMVPEPETQSVAMRGSRHSEGPT